MTHPSGWQVPIPTVTQRDGVPRPMFEIQAPQYGDFRIWIMTLKDPERWEKEHKLDRMIFENG